MNDEFSDRHRAIQLRLAGQSVAQICHVLHRSPRWFHKWWTRYLEFGPDGLFDFSHAAHQVARRMPPDLERTIVTIRRRLEARLHPGARYHLIGASAILAELQALHIRPVPSERTIERVLQQLGLTQPRVRLARWISQHDYPTPQAHTSNDLHQIDLVGPLYLKGKRQRYYILVCKDVFDGAVCLKLSRSRKMDALLAFLGDCWKTLGVPPRYNSTMPANWSVGGPPHAICRASFGCVCGLASNPSLFRPAARNTMAASRTSTAGFSRISCNDAIPSPVS
jgi:putative transposase